MIIFLHGLESSSQGSKARWFRHRFPDILIPDFRGTLDERMADLNNLLAQKKNLVLIGSSFGGLMATIYALENETRVNRVILLAPALNFPEFLKYEGRTTMVPAHLFIGSQDEVCPPGIVIPAVKKTFAHITIRESDDDHLLKATFPVLDWPVLLAE